MSGFPKNQVEPTIPWPSTWWQMPPCSLTSAFAYANGTALAVPILVPRAGIVTGLACQVTVVGTAGSVIRLGIYGADGQGKITGPPIFDDGGATILGTSATVQSHTGLNIGIGLGMYWLVAVPQGAPATNPTLTIGVQPSYQNSAPTLFGTLSLSSNFCVYSATGVTGALPNASAFSIAGSGTANPPIVAMQLT